MIHPAIIRSMLSFRAFLLITLMSSIWSCEGRRSSEGMIDPPQMLDERLTLSLFAVDPDIVTPIGIVVDSLDRIYVLESHTHQPPKDYAGPASDRIKIFTDSNKDGTAETFTVFSEGFLEGVNMAFSPEGSLYLVTSRAVYRLDDRDGNGISEERKLVMALTEPKSVYAHAALLGITFSEDGLDVYFERQHRKCLLENHRFRQLFCERLWRWRKRRTGAFRWVACRGRCHRFLEPCGSEV